MSDANSYQMSDDKSSSKDASVTQTGGLIIPPGPNLPGPNLVLARFPQNDNTMRDIIRSLKESRLLDGSGGFEPTSAGLDRRVFMVLILCQAGKDVGNLANAVPISIGGILPTTD